jgi:hypothetical protein
MLPMKIISTRWKWNKYKLVLLYCVENWFKKLNWFIGIPENTFNKNPSVMVWFIIPGFGHLWFLERQEYTETLTKKRGKFWRFLEATEFETKICLSLILGYIWKIVSIYCVNFYDRREALSCSKFSGRVPRWLGN